jgi:hypothetical protein
MKYSLIKDGAVLRTDNFETKPTIAASKGVWYEVVESEYPAATELEVVETNTELIEDNWVITHTKRDKTPLELWDLPVWAIRLRVNKSLLFEYPQFYLYFTDEGFPIMKNGNERLIYCNEILPEHEATFNALISQNKLIVEPRPAA